MTGHTKEPWAVSKHGDIQARKSADGDDLVAIRVMGSVRQSQYAVPNRVTRLANLHRAVDCVNALEGMNPAALGALIEAAEAARNRIWTLEATVIADGKTELVQRLEGWANDLSTALANLRGGAQ